MTTAIQTTYRGITFRSRLEAKWAAFFCAVGWRWEYEPIDLDGYIPDFVLPFPAGPILVEVKPIFDLDNEIARLAIDRINETTWMHEALIVGAGIFADDDGSAACGWLGEYFGPEDRPEDSEPEDSFWFDRATLFDCPFGCGITFRHDTNSYACRRCGQNYHSPLRMFRDDIEPHWNTAHNVTRWNAR